MFTELRLRNFKTWRETGAISLKPVTMLLGTNSSGKSTLIQSLLLLKQTVQSSDRTIHLNLGGVMRLMIFLISEALMMCFIVVMAGSVSS